MLGMTDGTSLLSARESHQSINQSVLLRPSLGLEAAVEAGEASQLEYWIVVLLVQPVAPVPGAGQSAVDARACNG